MKENEKPAFYTIDEFAKLVKVHPNTIRRAIKKGRLSAFKVNTQYRIPGNETERLALFDLREMIDRMIDEKQASKANGIV